MLNNTGLSTCFTSAKPTIYKYIICAVTERRLYQYRIPVSTGIFLITIGITFLIASLTVVYHSAGAALMNPVHALKNE